MSSWRIDACEPLCSARRQRHSQTAAARNEPGASLSPRVAASAARSRASSVSDGRAEFEALRRAELVDPRAHEHLLRPLGVGRGSRPIMLAGRRRRTGSRPERERWNWRSKACASWSWWGGAASKRGPRRRHPGGCSILLPTTRTSSLGAGAKSPAAAPSMPPSPRLAPPGMRACAAVLFLDGVTRSRRCRAWASPLVERTRCSLRGSRAPPAPSSSSSSSSDSSAFDAPFKMRGLKPDEHMQVSDRRRSPARPPARRRPSLRPAAPPPPPPRRPAAAARLTRRRDGDVATEAAQQRTRAEGDDAGAAAELARKLRRSPVAMSSSSRVQRSTGSSWRPCRSTAWRSSGSTCATSPMICAAPAASSPRSRISLIESVGAARRPRRARARAPFTARTPRTRTCR